MQKRSSWAIQKAVVFALVLRELRIRLSMRRMGAFWLVFEPMAIILVMVFERVLIRNVHAEIGGLNFPMYFITGWIPYMLFKNIITLGMAAIDANRSLFAYRQIKPLDCIIARTIVECVQRALVYALLMFVMGFWFKYDISIARPLGWLCILFLGILFSFSLSIIICIWAEAMPNIKIIVQLTFLPISLLSDLILPVSKLPIEIQRVLAWNPFLQLNVQLRTSISPIYPILPGVGINFVIFGTLILFPIAMALYYARRDSLISI